MIKAVALSDEEFAKFKCRGGTFYQYGNADGGHTVTEVNEYASADNNYQGSVKIVYFVWPISQIQQETFFVLKELQP